MSFHYIGKIVGPIISNAENRYFDTLILAALFYRFIRRIDTSSQRRAFWPAPFDTLRTELCQAQDTGSMVHADRLCAVFPRGAPQNRTRLKKAYSAAED
jgi:hypothetical protein